MKVLFCGGSGKAPSWKMRGEQIASTHKDWIACNDPTEVMVADADIIVVVKRFNIHLIKKLRNCGKPVIWDCLDFWPQSKAISVPEDIATAIMLAKRFVGKLNPDGIICANKQMAYDFKGMAEHVTHIYHHARLDAKPLPFAPIAWYDGCVKHAEESLQEIEIEGLKYGWKLAVGKPEGEGGMYIGVRDKSPGSWLAQRWKSNVKAANAISYKMPLLAQWENGYMETMGIDTPCYQIVGDSLAEAAKRARNVKPGTAYKEFDGSEYLLTDISKQYNSFFESVL